MNMGHIYGCHDNHKYCNMANHYGNCGNYNSNNHGNHNIYKNCIKYDYGNNKEKLSIFCACMI